MDADGRDQCGRISDPLLFSSGSASAEIDTNNEQTFEADGSGDLSGTFIVPDPFIAVDPAASCPPTSTEIAEGYYRCGIVMTDAEGNGPARSSSTMRESAPPSAADAGWAGPVGTKAVGVASTAYGGGYWLAWSDGTVTDYGDAFDLGDALSWRSTPRRPHHLEPGRATATGWWQLTAGCSRSATPASTAPWAGSTSTAGGVHGSRPGWSRLLAGRLRRWGVRLRDPLRRLRWGDSPSTSRWWESARHRHRWLLAAASDGGVFSFRVPYLGIDRWSGPQSAGGGHGGNSPAAVVTSWWLLTGVCSPTAMLPLPVQPAEVLAAPIVGATFDPLTGGYWLAGADGSCVFAFNAPFDGSS